MGFRSNRSPTVSDALCRFFDDMGMKGLDCPAPETRPKPG